MMCILLYFYFMLSTNQQPRLLEAACCIVISPYISVCEAQAQHRGRGVGPNGYASIPPSELAMKIKGWDWREHQHGRTGV